ncbi:MAG: DUF4340 domain-containing protein [Acidobacteria bacterium]|nr:DUF4340 domain-containing protein [Acidobacteriota bacterium]
MEVEKLDALLNSLQYGEVAAFISEGGSPLQPYGLDRPGVEVELTDEAGRRFLLKVGRRRDPSDPPPVAAADTSNPTYYALDESRPQVLAIFDVLYTQLREALFYFREKILWDIEPDQVETVRLRNRKGSYEFYRDPSSQWKVKDPASFRDRGVRWYKLFAAIDRVPVTDKIDRYENLRGFGLHDPDVRVEVRSRGETRGFSGGRSPSGGCYLKRDDSPTVMSVDGAEYAELEFSLPELLEPSESGAASQGGPASEKTRRPGNP